MPNPYGDYVSEVYAAPEHWLCRPPGSVDLCRDDLDATVLEAGGDRTVEAFDAAGSPGIDCFYVYPTVELDDSGNARFDGDYANETMALRTQAARFSGVCDVYAPLYRQRTLQATDPSAGEIAYADVLDAWKHYLANDGRGRGFVLIGHSQGASHLKRLVREEIENRPEVLDRMVSALLIGTAVVVPDGSDAGGDFARVPACRSGDQFGCVISYASFRDTSPPPPNSLFGRPRRGEGSAVCTNPAALEGGRAALDSYFSTASDGLFAAGAVRDDAVTTPFVRLPGLAWGECIEDGGFSYLQISVEGDPADPRPDDVPGDLSPEWGLHIVDVNLALGDLVSLVRGQSAAWTETHAG